MSVPVLHDYWRSSASYRVRIGAGLKGVALETVSVDLRTDAHLHAPTVEPGVPTVESSVPTVESSVPTV